MQQPRSTPAPFVSLQPPQSQATRHNNAAAATGSTLKKMLTVSTEEGKKSAWLHATSHHLGKYTFRAHVIHAYPPWMYSMRGT
jgi:hypothetical protein